MWSTFVEVYHQTRINSRIKILTINYYIITFIIGIPLQAFGG